MYGWQKEWKSPTGISEKTLVLSSLSGVCVRNKGGGQHAPCGAEEWGTLTKTLTLT